MWTTFAAHAADVEHKPSNAKERITFFIGVLLILCERRAHDAAAS
jgi:hypothetical protein